ncbi:hypothetical protein QFC20_002719 [Naganishia adeliensis]|uniref:Uncharacterized protein n=1 Tax=Naganishia adeliensis TaxID=92952 RepID=A0ACC2WHK4_9TREE|nr:hypothetical protein QFC20_002719 [Naganishia adeliensis]
MKPTKRQKKSALDQKDTGTYESCAILRTPEDGSTGHKDVVRCIYHDVKGYAVDENSLTGEETSIEEEDDNMAVDEEERDETEVSESTMSDRRKRRRV